MSIRTFIFCDLCNPQGIRAVEMRRGGQRDSRDGRRITDGRAWFEGGVEEARALGWAVSADGMHVCPECIARHRDLVKPAGGARRKRAARPRSARKDSPRSSSRHQRL